MPDPVDYRSALTGDYEQILALNSAAVPHVNLIDVDVLSHLHSQSALLDVAVAEEAVVGFILVLNDTADYDSLNFLYFRSRYARFRYVDRIVVADEWHRHGIGRALYGRVVASMSDRRFLTCEVNLKPSNPDSIAFHRALGFESVGEQDTECGSKRVLLMAAEIDQDARTPKKQPAVGS